MHVVGRRDGIPFLDCADRHHSNADPKIWDDAHMAALLADIREILREMGTNDRQFELARERRVGVTGLPVPVVAAAFRAVPDLPTTAGRCASSQMAN